MTTNQDEVKESWEDDFDDAIENVPLKISRYDKKDIKSFIRTILAKKREAIEKFKNEENSWVNNKAVDAYDKCLSILT